MNHNIIKNIMEKYFDDFESDAYIISIIGNEPAYSTVNVIWQTIVFNDDNAIKIIYDEVDRFLIYDHMPFHIDLPKHLDSPRIYSFYEIYDLKDDEDEVHNNPDWYMENYRICVYKTNIKLRR